MEKQLNPDDFLDCIHCGLCLTSCPTYTLLGNETDSPRGRICLMRSLAEATIGFTKNVVKHFDTCLECRACETACPSGVHFGELLEKTRNVVETVYERPKNEKRLRDFILKKALVSDRFLKISFKFVSLVNDFGLNFLFRFFPNHTQKILQKLPQTKPFEPLQEFYPA
ncbi:4Fe-4S dicluster domain-containing protein, partial [bacterium]|nr:4Fe-4S dicluster domain-containing protein [bacterium]